jgi:hypothetical protein
MIKMILKKVKVEPGTMAQAIIPAIQAVEAGR